MDNTFKKPSKCYLPKRYIVVVLGFMGMFNIYSMRVNLSVAMVAMVNSTAPSSMNDSRYSSECPAPAVSQQHSKMELKGHRYHWDPAMQGWVMSSFFYGYFVNVLLGGYIAERFGAIRIFGGSLFLTGILTLLTPVVVEWGVVPLMVLRALVGLGQGVTFPAMTVISSRWSPKLERTVISSIIFSGAHVGNAVTMSLSGWLCSTDFLGGWPSAFYVFGFITCVWYLFWCIFIYETPNAHPRISQAELSLFHDSGKVQNQNFLVPWRCIVTSVPFWAMMAGNFGFLFGTFMFFTELPTYISTVHHFNIHTVGMLSAVPYITICFGIWISSFAADRLRSFEKLNITTIRKLFHSIGGYGPCICLLLISQVGCRPFLIVALFGVALFLKGSMFSGFHIIMVDMCPDFAGTAFGITNGVSSLSGVMGPAMVGYFTENGYTIANWNKGFYVTAAIYFVTTTFFAIFASAELQPWGRAEIANKEENNSENTGQKETAEHALDQKTPLAC